MSTDISNGYRIEGIYDLKTLYHFRKKVQDLLEKIQKELYFKRVAEISSEILDLASIYDMKRFKQLLHRYVVDVRGKNSLKIESLEKVTKVINDESVKQQISELKKEQKENLIKTLLGRRLDYAVIRYLEDSNEELKRTMQRNPHDDLDCKITIIPTEEKCYAMIYAEQEEFIHAWEQLEEVSPYPYWNHSDGIEGLTREEWKKRGDEWDQVLGKGIPTLVGFNIEGLVSFPHLEIDKVISYIKPYEKRAKKLAYESTMNQKIKELINEEDETDYSTTMEAFFKAREWLDTEEGKEKQAKEEKRIQSLIINEFKVEHFNKKIEAYLK